MRGICPGEGQEARFGVTSENSNAGNVPNARPALQRLSGATCAPCRGADRRRGRESKPPLPKPCAPNAALSRTSRDEPRWPHSAGSGRAPAGPRPCWSACRAGALRRGQRRSRGCGQVGAAAGDLGCGTPRRFSSARVRRAPEARASPARHYECIPGARCRFDV